MSVLSKNTHPWEIIIKEVKLKMIKRKELRKAYYENGKLQGEAPYKNGQIDELKCMMKWKSNRTSKYFKNGNKCKINRNIEWGNRMKTLSLYYGKFSNIFGAQRVL